MELTKVLSVSACSLDKPDHIPQRYTSRHYNTNILLVEAYNHATSDTALPKAQKPLAERYALTETHQSHKHLIYGRKCI